MPPPDAPINVAHVLEVLQFLTSVVILPGAIALFRRLGDIRDHLARINGNVVEINQWRADHEDLTKKMDDNALDIRSHCQKIHQERMNNVQQQLQQLWGRVGDSRTDVPKVTD